MNLKETAGLLGWKRELVVSAIEQGIETPSKKLLIKLAATKQGSDYDIQEEGIDALLSVFEKEEPGRNPPVSTRRELLVESRYKCSICKSDAPLHFHHIIEWASLTHHDPKHMLAVCGSCHDKIGRGTIDTKSQQEFKKQLRYSYQSKTAVSDSAENAKPSATSQILNQSENERIVWCLPRGFLMMEDVNFSDRVDWSVVIHYYHFGEGWRYGTHFHESYADSWQGSANLKTQCHKVALPKADYGYAYGAFHLMQKLRNTDKPIDVKYVVEAHAKGGDLVFYYEPSKPIFSSEIENKYPQLKNTGELRDLIEEMDEFIGEYHGQTNISSANEGFSIGHRVIVEATKFLGECHPSMTFLKMIVGEYDRKWSTPKIKEWMKQLCRVTSDALKSF